MTALQTCLTAICSPVTLNPDLAGIGVSLPRIQRPGIALTLCIQVIASFIIQSGICIIALAALVTLEWLSWSGRVTKNAHTALITALVDFHKIQCFFSCTIQITALILFQESQNGIAQDTNAIGSPFKDFFDTSILIVLATSGFIPIAFTLACISRYGRQSWYMLIISLITILLGTATLACSYYDVYKYGIQYDLYTSNMQNPFLYNNNYYNNVSVVPTICNIPGSVGELVFPLCGSSKLGHNAVGPTTVANHRMLAVWANCVAWFVFCAAKHCYNGEGNWGKRYGLRFHAACVKYPGLKTLSRSMCWYRFWMILFLAIWSLCFASQFYLFSVYFEHSVISEQWSFGQIIAVTIWIPSIVEYVYMEYNESGYSPHPQVRHLLIQIKMEPKNLLSTDIQRH